MKVLAVLATLALIVIAGSLAVIAVRLSDTTPPVRRVIVTDVRGVVETCTKSSDLFDKRSAAC